MYKMSSGLLLFKLYPWTDSGLLVTVEWFEIKVGYVKYDHYREGSLQDKKLVITLFFLLLKS